MSNILINIYQSMKSIDSIAVSLFLDWLSLSNTESETTGPSAFGMSDPVMEHVWKSFYGALLSTLC